MAMEELFTSLRHLSLSPPSSKRIVFVLGNLLSDSLTFIANFGRKTNMEMGIRLLMMDADDGRIWDRCEVSELLWVFCFPLGLEGVVPSV